MKYLYCRDVIKVFCTLIISEAYLTKSRIYCGFAIILKSETTCSIIKSKYFEFRKSSKHLKARVANYVFIQ